MGQQLTILYPLTYIVRGHKGDILSSHGLVLLGLQAYAHAQARATSNTDVATDLKELNHTEIQSRMICDDIVDDDFSVEEIKVP